MIKSSHIPILKRRQILAFLASAITAPLAFALERLPRPVAAFRADDVATTLAELSQGMPISASEAIRIAAADLAENGAVVPIKVAFELSEVRSLSIVASKNPVPLVARFLFGQAHASEIATRIKLAESCDVVVLIETADGFFSAQKSIEVTVGGCGV